MGDNLPDELRTHRRELQRNDRSVGAADNIRAAMLLGIVFVETLTLFTFAVGFLLYLKL